VLAAFGAAGRSYIIYVGSGPVKPIELKLKVHSKTRNRASVNFVVGCLAACGLMTSTAVAQGLVRAEFQSQTTATPGVFDDGQAGFTCISGVDEYHFDYLDANDSGVDCFPDPAGQSGFNMSSTSPGGGWALKVGEEYFGQNPRNVRIDFSVFEPGADCELLEDTFLSDMGLDCGCWKPCDVNVWITADKLFKNNTTRDSLSRFDIVEVGGDGPDGPDLKIRYHEDLYICDAAGHPGDDWQVLKSAPCEDPNLAAGALADVILSAGSPGQNEILGQWLLPFHVIAQRVTPSGDEPPGCTDADNDGVCVEEGDCDDSNPHVYPGHNDTKGKWGRDGVDNDCNGTVDG
jgi:hypothetical protein